MMKSTNIIEVNEVDFEYEVVAYSQNTPVVVDFWAPWCQPCKAVGEILAQIASESTGSFRLARLNTDDNPNLAIQFGVRSLPTIKAFSSGQVVGELVGAQPESRLREFISKITPPSPLTLKTEKAEGYLASREWIKADLMYREVLDGNPDSSVALLGLGIALLGEGKGYEAREIFENFPSSKEYSRASLLLPLALEFTKDEKVGTDSVSTDLEIAFKNCVRLAKQAKFDAAIDGLLDILRQDKKFKDGSAQRIILAILEVIYGDEVTVRSYRKELASVLY
jgi:putative thioredoxin